MSTATNLPLPVGSPPDRADRALDPLLAEPFARVYESPLVHEAAAQALRSRLLGRVAASREAEAAMFTSRRRRLPREALAEGVTAQTLYLAQAGRPLRRGEPLRARLIELAPAARLEPASLDADAQLEARHREWLVLSGSVRLGEQLLSQRDYHVTPAGHASPAWTTADGALLFLRESAQAALPGDVPFTVFDADAGWPDFAPAIQRRVLWQRDGQAALLYYAQPGAQVPKHTHGHDEECLMLQGELFLDDVLLQPGDYQVAPAGTGHRITETDTGVVIYAHGDLDLDFTA
jgi:ChrR Cupin-like domain